MGVILHVRARRQIVEMALWIVARFMAGNCFGLALVGEEWVHPESGLGASTGKRPATARPMNVK